MRVDHAVHNRHRRVFRDQRHRRWPLALIFTLLLWPIALLTASADRPNGAGLVIRHGDGHIEMHYVEFTEPEITGLDLLQRAGVPITIATYPGLGAAVCAINQEGCPAENCFCKSYSNPAYFWHYYRLTPEGTWILQTVGASNRKIHDGDVDGWSWTAGASGLPATSIDAIAAQAGVQRHTQPTAGPSPLPPTPPPALPSQVQATVIPTRPSTPTVPPTVPPSAATSPPTMASTPQPATPSPPAIMPSPPPGSPSPSALPSPTTIPASAVPSPFSTLAQPTVLATPIVSNGPSVGSVPPQSQRPGREQHRLAMYSIYGAFVIAVIGLMGWTIWRRHIKPQRGRE